MELTHIVIKKNEKNERVKAYVDFIINDCFAVHDARIIEGSKGLFVAMPSRKIDKGFKDICHPITQKLRQMIDNTIIEKYKSENNLEKEEGKENV